MVPNLMALVVNAFEQSSVILSCESDQKECRFDVLVAKNIQDARRETRIWPVVKGDGDLMRFAAVCNEFVWRG